MMELEFRLWLLGTSVTNTGTAVNLYLRQPGKVWLDIECTVAQMGDGDWQAAAILAGNLALTPTRPLPVDTVVVSTQDFEDFI